MQEFRRLFERASPYRTRLYLALACSILASPFGFLQAQVLKLVCKNLELDRLTVLAERGDLLERMVFLSAGIPLFFLVNGLFTYGSSYLTAHAAQSVVADLRADLFRTLVDRPVGWLASGRSADFVTRITSDIQRIEVGLCVRSVDLLINPLRALLLTIYLWVLSPRLALIATILLPLAALLVRRWARKIRVASRTGQERMSEIATILSETLGGIRVVKAYLAEAHETARFSQANENLRRVTLRAYRTSAAASPILEALGGFVLAVLFCLAANEILAERLSYGSLLAFFAGMLLLYGSIKKIANATNEMQHAAAAARRCFDVLDADVAGPETAPAGGPVAGLEHTIEFQSVGFAYGEREVLSDFNLVVHRGETVALVGESGAGKTTVTSLLARFADPTAGRILWDGRDTRTIPVRSLRSHVALVTQDTVVFDETVLANIAYGDPRPDRARAQDAAEAAAALDFIEQLENGWDTRLGERGGRLSGGQRQRIAMARALYKNAPVWILDEPTSALDSKSEALLQDRIRELLRGRTAFVVAHRLSTVKDADRIVVMLDGRIVQSGTHDQLLAREGAYQHMHRLQSGTG